MTSRPASNTWLSSHPRPVSCTTCVRRDGHEIPVLALPPTEVLPYHHCLCVAYGVVRECGTRRRLESSGDVEQMSGRSPLLSRGVSSRRRTVILGTRQADVEQMSSRCRANVEHLSKLCLLHVWSVCLACRAHFDQASSQRRALLLDMQIECRADVGQLSSKCRAFFWSTPQAGMSSTCRGIVGHSFVARRAKQTLEEASGKC